MIYIYKLITGEEVIGDSNDSDNLTEYHNIENPMTFMDMSDQTGVTSFKLVNSLMLSSEELLTVHKKNVVAWYRPSEMMEEYYRKAVVYSAKHTEPAVDRMLEQAIFDINAKLVEDKKDTSELTELLLEIYGTTLH